MKAIKKSFKKEIETGQQDTISDTRDYPIIFDTQMVKKIVFGIKTETRRPFKRVLNEKIHSAVKIYKNGGIWVALLENGKMIGFDCPYGEPGDLLWVKETWSETNNIVSYKAAHSNYVLIRNKKNLSWKASIHMRKADSRLWLYIKEISIQKIQSINEDEAFQEGVDPCKILNFNNIKEPTFREGFYKKWISIYGIESWHENPWVWVIKFTKHPINNT